MNKVLHVIPQTSMVNGHAGLLEVVKQSKLKVNPEELKPGEFIIFINTPFNAVKLLAANNVLIYYKHPKGHMLNYEALRLVPTFFDGQQLNYPAALKSIIKKKYPEITDEGQRN